MTRLKNLILSEQLRALLPMCRAGNQHRQPRAGITPGGIGLGLGQENAFRKICSPQIGIPEISACQIGTAQINAFQICGDQAGAPQIRASQILFPQVFPKIIRCGCPERSNSINDRGSYWATRSVVRSASLISSRMGRFGLNLSAS